MIRCWSLCWLSEDPHCISSSTYCPNCRTTCDLAALGGEASGGERQSVTSGWMKVYESHIPTRLPLNEPTSWGSKFTATPVSLQMDFSPAALGCACSAINASQDSHRCLVFPSPLPPQRAHKGGRFWLSASRILLWTAHKAIAFQFCPEREKNSFLRLKHRVWRPRMVRSTFRERRFLIFTCICCH